VQGTQDGLVAVMNMQLGEYVGDVVAHRLLAEHQPGGYLPISQALGDECENLKLPRGVNSSKDPATTDGVGRGDSGPCWDT